jgi:hypothetical protein
MKGTTQMKRALRTAQYLAISAMSGSLAMAAISACSASSSGGSGGEDAAATPDGAVADTSTPDVQNEAGADATGDAGLDASLLSDVVLSDVVLSDVVLPDVVLPDVGLPDAVLPGLDTGVDAPVDAGLDAAPEAEASAQNFCALQSGLAFCEDFDEPDALWTPDGGAASVWTNIVGTSTDLSVSDLLSTSPPDSLLVTAGQTDMPSAVKVVKEVASPVTQAIYEYDINLAAVPTSAYAGGFATDFQFSDVPGTDSFGFRIGVFNANASLTGSQQVFSADFEHNDGVTGGGCGPCGTTDAGLLALPLATGSWQHVKIAVAFSAAANDAGDAGAPGSVSVQLYLNKSATATLDMTLPAPFAAAPFARISTGLADTWTTTNDNWGIYYDNITLKVQ